MTKLQKITLAFVAAVGLACLLPLPAWADWGPPTGSCANPGGGDNINCFKGGPYWVQCTWKCVPAPNCTPGFSCPYVPKDINCKIVPSC